MRALMRTVALLVVALAIGAPAHAFRQRKVSTTSYPNCFKLVDSSDHVTAKTSATVTCTRSKNGGSFASCSGSVSEVANGIYCLAGHATDRDTVGTLVFHMTASGADANNFEIEITTNDPFANLDTSTAVASVTGAVGSVTGNVGGNVVGSVGSVTGNVGGNVTGSVGSVATGGITAASIAADAIGASELAADAVSEVQSGLATAGDIPSAATIADAVLDEQLSGHTTAGSAGKKLSDIPTSGGGATAAEVWAHATRTLTNISGETTVVSPVGTGGLITLTRNDDYACPGTRCLTISRDGWEDLSGYTIAEIRLTARSRVNDRLWFTATDYAAARDFGAGEQTVAFALTNTDTSLLVPGVLTGKYDIQVTTSSPTKIITLEVTDTPSGLGGITVYEDQTRP
jgi:hypothetical protein